MPTREIVAKQSVDDANANLKQQMRASGVPSHLLRLGHALVDDLVDRRFDEGAEDAPAAPESTSVVGQRVGVVMDI